MELSIGKMIFDLRKKKGITQEQLANAVGVSVPAVSKWETGNSYPDIALLIPIARYLGVSVDTLLHYESDISPEKVLKIADECSQKFETEGYGSGFSLCIDYLKEYPNNLILKLRIAFLLPWYAAKKGTPQDREEALCHAVSLLTEAGESKDEKIRSESLYLLACTYIQMDRNREAQDILERLPKTEVDPGKLLVTVYMQQNDIQKAVYTSQHNLLAEVSGAAFSLSSLSLIALREEKFEDALKYAGVQLRLFEAFDLKDFWLLNNSQLYLSIYSRMKDMENTLFYLKRYLSAFPYDAEKLRLSDNFFFHTAEYKEIPAAMNLTRDMVVQALEEDKDMDFLRNDKRFCDLIEGFEKSGL
jgi:transcriptional regulator with XRE-family HTH domain